MKILLLLIGMILVLEGLPYAASPERMQQWLRQLVELPARQLRVLGLIAMMVGFFICFLVQKTSIFG